MQRSATARLHMRNLETVILKRVLIRTIMTARLPGRRGDTGGLVNSACKGTETDEDRLEGN